ncbi:MAG TPA: primosomal protein N' [Polyangiaceae bacterium]|jgi:primosomal protein N' (replication factor Y)|nr:primosomal protein N' [Polyangiaceae bacterium]
MGELYADVGIPVPLGQSFTYRVTDALADKLRPGTRVVCEFGQRKVLGIVLGTSRQPPAFDLDKLKPIAALIDPEPALPEELLGFVCELAAYYFAPIGEVLRLALPAVERERVRALQAQGSLLPGEVPDRTRQVGGRLVLFARATDRVEEPGRLRGQAAAVLALLRSVGEQPVSQLVTRYKNARNALAKLETLGLVELEKRALDRAPIFETPERDAPPELNPAQRAAVERIGSALGTPSGFLLFGVTGSGKTEVYMHVIERALASKRGALVLVPEIALTPQLLGRFRARFGDEVAVLHSALAEADRHQMWQRLRSGELLVAVGARSALFAPVRDLGLVVVDEEHDSSFKQEEGVRYHARDMALLRAHRAGAVAVLGSATPSLEAVALVQRGKLVQLELPERATRASLPAVEIIDLKRFGPGPSGDRLLSLPLHRAIEETLAAGEQTIVFLNRRGFAPAVVCEGCGVVLSCRHCSVALTFHRRASRLICHYCDHQSALTEQCPECRRGELSLEGLGTEKLESTIAAAFPGARVARLDRDVAAGARSARILDRMRAGEIDILVGTQMVTKGHDLPRVTLVGVVNADAALSLPDFRAAERGFQLLVQVAGRAGRHDRRGRVLIQTRNPDHAAVIHAAQHDVAGFLAHELRDRREVRYPPFSRLSLVRVDAVDEKLARKSAARFAAHARSAPEVAAGHVEVLGPAPAPIARLRNRYRFRVMLRSGSRPALRAVLALLVPLQKELDRKVRTVLDVDPVAML